MWKYVQKLFLKLRGDQIFTFQTHFLFLILESFLLTSWCELEVWLQDCLTGNVDLGPAKFDVCVRLMAHLVPGVPISLLHNTAANMQHSSHCSLLS